MNRAAAVFSSAVADKLVLGKMLAELGILAGLIRHDMSAGLDVCLNTTLALLLAFAEVSSGNADIG